MFYQESQGKRIKQIIYQQKNNVEDGYGFSVNVAKEIQKEIS